MLIFSPAARARGRLLPWRIGRDCGHLGIVAGAMELAYRGHRRWSDDADGSFSLGGSTLAVAPAGSKDSGGCAGPGLWGHQFWWTRTDRAIGERYHVAAGH